MGCSTALCSVRLLSSVGVHFSLVLNKLCCLRQSHRVHLDPKGHILYFTVGLGCLNSLFFFLSSRLLSVFITLSCVWLMVSEAAKFSVNASPPLVRPVGIDFEDNVRRHKARGNEEPKT